MPGESAGWREGRKETWTGSCHNCPKEVSPILVMAGGLAHKDRVVLTSAQVTRWGHSGRRNSTTQRAVRGCYWCNQELKTDLGIGGSSVSLNYLDFILSSYLVAGSYHHDYPLWCFWQDLSPRQTGPFPFSTLPGASSGH